MSPKNKTTLSPRLDSRLVAYAALAAAALAAPAVAEATIITNNINLPVPDNFDGVYLDFLTGTTDTATFTGWDINAYHSTTSGVFSFFWPATASSGGVDTADGADVYASLSIGDVVSSASPFTQAAG